MTEALLRRLFAGLAITSLAFGAVACADDDEGGTTDTETETDSTGAPADETTTSSAEAP